VAVNFVIASGEVHALGGVSFVKAATGEIEVGGFLRIGGSIEVLGLVSVSVELLIVLKYESTDNRLVGRATLVIEVDLTFISESVTTDSGVWVLAGGEEPQHGQEPITTGTADGAFDLAAWRHYREAFASLASWSGSPFPEVPPMIPPPPG